MSGSNGSGKVEPGDEARENRAGITAAVFRSVNREGIRYALLRNCRQVLSGVARDVDILVAPGDRRRFVAGIAEAVAESSGWQVIQLIRSRYGTRVALLYREEYSILFDLQSVIPLETGLAPARVILKGSRLTPEGVSLLARERFLTCLTLHYRKKPKPEYDQILRQAFLAEKGLEDRIGEEIDRLHRRYRSGFFHRIFRRATDYHYWISYFRPSGIFVVVNGPDGVGKTTVLRNLQERLEGLAVCSRVKHLGGKTGVLPERPSRPGGSRKSLRRTVAAPGSKRSFRILVDLPRLLYHFLDIQLFYWISIRRFQAAGGWFIADKYFTYTVKARDMGFSVPENLIKMIYRLLPQPDIYLLFYNDPEEVSRRKGELTPREAEALALALRELSCFCRRRKEIKTDRTVHQVADEVLEVLIGLAREKVGR